MNKQRVGVIGCGSMGLPMALCLRKKGFQVAGHDVRSSSEFGEFAGNMETDVAQFARSCDVLVSVVRDEDQTLDVCFNDQAIFRMSEYPGCLVVCSTLSPRFIQNLRKQLPADVALVDAPMSGAPYSAENGSLTFMLGGEADTIESLMPIFKLMGDKIHALGTLGSGMTVKVLNNYVAAMSTVAVRRVLGMAAALDVESATLRDVMGQSSGATWFGDNFEQISWSREGYDPGNTIGILEKDVKSALDAVRDLPDVTGSDLDEALLVALKQLR